MKKISRIMLGIAAALMATSCSDTPELPDTPVNPGEEGSGVYLSVNVQMPSTSNGSRSNTTEEGGSNDGTEIGKDYENAVSAVAIVLTDTKNGFIAWGHVDNPQEITSASDKRYKSTAKISRTDLAQYYEQKPAPTNFDVNVFIFCNPTSDLEAKFDAAEFGSTAWVNETCEVIESATETNVNTGIWAKNSFLMNNQKIAVRSLPSTIDAWENFTTEDKPFNLSATNIIANGDDVYNGEEDRNGMVQERGAIKVERSVARFDFKDGSEKGNNTYDVVFGFNDKGVIGEGSPVFMQVQLNRMALVNMAKKFYYLHRISADGTDANWEICGNELGGTAPTYVVGPYWKTFQSYLFKSNPIVFGEYFNFPYFNNNGTIDNTNTSSDKWGSALIATVLGNETDDYAGPDHKNNTYNHDYHIWRYATENVIPSANQQKNGISTGIVFKGKIIATKAAVEADAEKYPGMSKLATTINGQGLTGNPSTDPILYSFNGNLYLSFFRLHEAAIAAAVEFKDGEIVNVNRNNSLYKAVFGTGGMGTFTYPYDSTNSKEYTDPDNEALPLSKDCTYLIWKEWYENRDAAQATVTANLAAMRNAVTSAGITIYQSSNDAANGVGYYCYYTYWNRHNNNGRSGVMGPMEFAVVRNNVYKLAVTKISRLGHPRISANDPDPDTPDTPDEKDDVYITVECYAIPWVVRLNNIEF